MDSSNDKAMPPGMRTLRSILSRALEMRADCVRLEYDRGELELYFVSGATGIGSVVDSDTAKQVVATIVESAKLASRPSGKMNIKLGEDEYAVHVRQYENFTEPAFELRITPEKMGRSRTRRRSGPQQP